MIIIPYIVIISCALVGLAISLHIDWSKRHNHKIICPTESDCEMVIYSKYSHWKGIPWEDIGALYYFLVVLTYLTFWSLPVFVNIFTLSLAAFFSLLASAVAGYLVYVQGRILQEWCTLCLLSSLMCFSILLGTLALWF